MQRRVIEVTGIVQGVGFRPFVQTLASRLGLSGFVQNRTGAVWIEVQGRESILETFLDRLQSSPPPLAKIQSLRWHHVQLRENDSFQIAQSTADDGGDVFISPDIATCDECRRELFDRQDRRFGYPFLNCTHCGPRLTIIQGAPYDRIRTTMSRFPMCDQCRAEYQDPENRRYHAQPIACPKCGPRLRLLDTDGNPIKTDDPLGDFVEAILKGMIGALKGVGGYHLVCFANRLSAVRRLRERKHRDEKPFAIMVGDVDAARTWCQIDELEERLLRSSCRPIVLLRKRTNGPELADVSPRNTSLGVMLPSTPLHELLFDQVADEPLVMTSGNRSDEPIAYDDADAIDRLQGIADLFLVHDRPIHVRCDDSVTRVVAGRESPIRRSRGIAPLPIPLPFTIDAPILAVGGQLKGVFALAKGTNAFLSHHMGDLDHLDAWDAFRRDIDLYQQLFDIDPQCIVHDLHPDYASTIYAVKRSADDEISRFSVQHHHAHLASCMAENRLNGQVIGVTFDGSGWGSDGTIWGGEILVGGYRQFERAAHLCPVRLPGGDQATKEPWRMALSHLVDSSDQVDDLLCCDASATALVRKMIDRGLNSPWTSSAGRLFDAVAALLGIRQSVTFEGQAAIELEGFASESDCDKTYRFAFEYSENQLSQDVFQIDTRRLIADIVQDRRHGVAISTIAKRFHNTLAEIIVQSCSQIRSRTELDRVVLSGGVFMNALLGVLVTNRLTRQDFSVFCHQMVPANDGGLCLGQLAIAAHRNPATTDTANPITICQSSQ